MKVSTHVWSQVPRDFCDKLHEFERQFDYPLNAQHRFRIEHSVDYTKFFAAMGEAATIVVEREGTILGVLSATIRTLELERGKSERWLYIGDVKISPKHRGKRVLHLLFAAARTWVGGRCSKGYSVVMGGTNVTPSMYTGRVGIPAFQPVASVSLLAYSTDGTTTSSKQTVDVETIPQSQFDPVDRGLQTRRLKWPRWIQTDPRLRSDMEPYWLFHQESGCFALLEDTRRAKRLYDDVGDEIRFAHLTNLWYEDIDHIQPIIELACAMSRLAGNAELLVCIPQSMQDEMLNRLPEMDTPRVLEATVFATETEASATLPIWSSEI